MPRQAEVKRLMGAMDTDSTPETIHEQAHRTARNGRFMGLPGNEVFQVIDGMSQVSGQSLPAGSNKTIGRLYDAKNYRIFFFNKNSNGNHGIYIFNTQTGIFQTLVEVGSNTDGDILGFDFSRRIYDPAILYGDPLEGDILFYLDTRKFPRQINVGTYLSPPATYIPIKENFLKVIKAPPDMPPRCVYENDTTVNTNNLNLSLFQFAYAWGYDNNNYSRLSGFSQVALPTISFSNTANVDRTLNSRIRLYLRTGDVNVKKIRIFMRQVTNGAISDWLRVDTIDKSVGPIQDNGIYQYLFFNDGNYTPEDIQYTNEPFDYVPQKAGSQVIANGNVVMYGDITEGYNWMPTMFSTQETTSPPSSAPFIINGFLFFGDYNGTFTGSQPNIELFITGAGTNDVNGNPSNLGNIATLYYLSAKSSGTDISFSSTIGFQLVSAMLTTLAASAVAAGWVLVQTKTNSIVIYYPTGTVVLGSTYSAAPLTPPSLMANNAQLSHYPEGAYSYGLAYFDADGRTNGALTDLTANLTTLPFNFGGIGNPTWITINLSGITPPSWAVRWKLLRTNTLTYVKHTYWVSNRALSNVSTLAVNQYAYISFSNMFDYNQQIQATSGVVSYGFAQGDRIRFVARYDLSNASHAISHDYAILGVEDAPVINGTPQVGSFIKIAYPSADVASDPNFKLDGTDDFQQYLILLYSIASNNKPQTENTGTSVAEGNVYYEIGYEFPIGNPGLNTAFHFGNIADNQVQLADGDIFYRQRTVPAGLTKYIIVQKFDESNRYVTIPIPILSMVNPQFTIGPQNGLNADPFAFTNYPRFSDGGGLYLNTSPITRQVRLRTTFQVVADHPTYVDIYVKVCNNDGTTGVTNVILNKSDPVSVTSLTNPTQITYDATFGVPAGAKVWLIYGNADIVVNAHFQGHELRLDDVNNVTVPIFESSYSDIYSLVTNSDGRPHVEDHMARQIEFDGMYRWSQPDQLGTAINDTNRFFFQDADEVPKSNGAIVRLSVLEKLLYIFQQIKCGTTGIFQKYIRNNEGASQLIVNDQIIEKNNIQYEVYEGGIGNQGGSLVISNFAHYFVDPVKGYINRWSNDGVTPLSLLYRTQTWAGANLPLYLIQHSYQFGGNSEVLGAFRVFTDKSGEYLLMAQGDVNNPNLLPGEILSFDESKNAFTSFHDINCDDMVAAENQMYYFYNGLLWKQSLLATPANFFGVQKTPTITLIFNRSAAVKKAFGAVAYQASDFWTSNSIGDVITSQFNSQTGLQQTSNLINDLDGFSIQDGNYYAAFRRDANSMVNHNMGVCEGDYLIGNWIQLKLSYAGTARNFLFSPYITYRQSPRNF